MAVSLPDIIGDYIATQERFETSGVQYAGYFEPATIAPKQTAHLYLFLQNALNVPVEVYIKTSLPHTGGLFRSGRPILKVGAPVVQVPLTAGEAGLLTLPVTTTENLEAGQHLLTLELKVVARGRGQRIRPKESQSRLDTQFIDNPVGLNLVRTMGATFVEKSVKKASFPLEIAGKPQPSERAPRLKHKYETIWVQTEMDLFNQAIHELNLRQVKLNNELTIEALYATLYGESVSRFADAGLPLRVGEAITLAKILTYTGQFFLSSQHRRNGLLVPIWERALETGADTSNALQVIRSVGYYHLLRLSIAISFGVVARAVGRQVWSLTERQAVIQHIADSIEMGQALDTEFLYLPLLMAGTYISGKVRFEGEDIRQSLALMRRAREVRTDLFLDDDLAEADRIYDHILNKALQSV